MMAADTSDIVAKAQYIHNTSAVCSAALGRLLTGASFMGQTLKADNASVTLRINGGGAAGSVIAVSDSKGNVRGYIANPDIVLPLNNKGKLDVGKAVGTDGFLSVMRDTPGAEPYVGQVPIVSGEIAEDITSYYAVSEQTPTVCALGVLVNPDRSIALAGGYLIQLLPFTDDETINTVESCIEKAKSVTSMLREGMTPLDICRRVLPDSDMQLLDETEIDYVCPCSKDRVKQALISSGKQGLAEMAEDEITRAVCHFCNTEYTFTSAEIKKLLSEAQDA